MSDEPHFVQRFAKRQLELMQSEGLSQEKAYLRVKEEAAAAATAAAAPGADPSDAALMAAPPGATKALAEVQKREEDVLREAERKGVLHLSQPRPVWTTRQGTPAVMKFRRAVVRREAAPDQA